MWTENQHIPNDQWVHDITKWCVVERSLKTQGWPMDFYVTKYKEFMWFLNFTFQLAFKTVPARQVSMWYQRISTVIWEELLTTYFCEARVFSPMGNNENNVAQHIEGQIRYEKTAVFYQVRIWRVLQKHCQSLNFSWKYSYFL